jgi:hypothetical protein
MACSPPELLVADDTDKDENEYEQNKNYYSNYSTNDDSLAGW